MGSMRARHGSLLLVALLVAAALAGCSGPLPVPPPDPEAPPLFAQAWGSHGSKNHPVHMTGVAVGPTGDVYVTDSGNARVQRFTSSGVHVTTWGSPGTTPGKMDFPTAVAVDATGNVYVSDSQNRRIQKFDANGTFLSAWGSFGTANGKFQMARGIAIDPQGHVIVSDAQNHRIQKFDANGTFLAKWGSYGSGNGQLSAPRGIATDATGNVYVADYANHRVQVFSGSGAFLHAWGAQGTGPGEFSFPYGVAIDAEGSVYVTDSQNHRVQKFSPLGGFKSTWGDLGTAQGEFNETYGVAASNASAVFVVDGVNDRVQKFRYMEDAIDVNVLLDGVPWAGPVSFTVSGPQTFHGASAPWYTEPAAPGTYAIAVASGGPPGAHFVPGAGSAPKTLAPEGAIAFTLEFTSPTAVRVVATLDGVPWSGPLAHDLTGFDWATSTSHPFPGTSVPRQTNVTVTLINMSGVGSGMAMPYTVQALGGGPPGANLTAITPSPTESAIAHHTTTFTLHYSSGGLVPNSILLNATLDGAPWSGPLSWQAAQFAWPSTGITFAGAAVPQVLSNVPQSGILLTDPQTGVSGLGSAYAAQRLSGGPPSATFVGIDPDFYVILHENTTRVFTFRFVTPIATTGAATVAATLDGAPWNGTLGHTLNGPQPTTGAAVPSTHASLAPGTYTLNHTSGGPGGAALAGITPSATAGVSPGNTTAFTLHFRSKPTVGVLRVNATLDGAPWTGLVNYTLTGPQTLAGTSAPQAFQPTAGSYALAYGSGGPPNATLVAVPPSVTQSLAAGGSAAFTLQFVTVGTITIEATSATPGGVVAWTGPLNFTLTGPQTLLGSSVGQIFASALPGTYTFSYASGGPPGQTLQSVTVAPTQTLSPGGTLTFRLNFR